MPAVMQFGDVHIGRCDHHGYPFYDHTEDLDFVKVDLYVHDKGVQSKRTEAGSALAILEPAADEGGPAEDCGGIASESSFKFNVSWSPVNSTCTLACAAKGGNLGCMAFPDGID